MNETYVCYIRITCTYNFFCGVALKQQQRCLPLSQCYYYHSRSSRLCSRICATVRYIVVILLLLSLSSSSSSSWPLSLVGGDYDNGTQWIRRKYAFVRQRRRARARERETINQRNNTLETIHRRFTLLIRCDTLHNIQIDRAQTNPTNEPMCSKNGMWSRRARQESQFKMIVNEWCARIQFIGTHKWQGRRDKDNNSHTHSLTHTPNRNDQMTISIKCTSDVSHFE